MASLSEREGFQCQANTPREGNRPRAPLQHHRIRHKDSIHAIETRNTAGSDYSRPGAEALREVWRILAGWAGRNIGWV